MLTKMFKIVDNFLNRTTMYRLVLYYVAMLWIVAVIFSFFGLLPYEPAGLVFSGLFLIAVCLAVNKIFAYVFGVPTNVESLYITALILALIIPPLKSANYVAYFPLAIWAGVWAMASKFILAVKKKHVFNPVAFAVALTSFTIGQSASWWIASPVMIPFVLFGGLLIVKKIIRFDLVLSFFAAVLATVFGFGLAGGSDPSALVWKAVVYSPMLFFAFAMLTEPLTTPPTRTLRIAYGALTGFLFAPMIHLGPVYSTPELALLAGNVFSYAVSPKKKLVLRLEQKQPLTPDVCDFVFKFDEPISFRPGQYMEWTLAHRSPDNRGNRRYFTVASSPTENELRIGVKFYPESSSFKNHMTAMDVGDEIIASQLAGDFVLPKDKNKKLVFIAGGIGITPFRSMVKYLLDKNEARQITMFYSNKTMDDIVYKDIFDAAASKLGIKTVYALTDRNAIPPSWTGYSGFVDAKMIVKEVPDYLERTFYISGPRSMVLAFEETLRGMGVGRRRIKTDYFPGFA